jgi:hypothetical protein
MNQNKETCNDAVIIITFGKDQYNIESYGRNEKISNEAKKVGETIGDLIWNGKIRIRELLEVEK